jgi:hypothetical protein
MFLSFAALHRCRPRNEEVPSAVPNRTVLPWLYLHGVSTGNMREALAVLVGPEAKGLSAPVVARHPVTHAKPG